MSDFSKSTSISPWSLIQDAYGKQAQGQLDQATKYRQGQSAFNWGQYQSLSPKMMQRETPIQQQNLPGKQAEYDSNTGVINMSQFSPMTLNHESVHSQQLPSAQSSVFPFAQRTLVPDLNYLTNPNELGAELTAVKRDAFSRGITDPNTALQQKNKSPLLDWFQQQHGEHQKTVNDLLLKLWPGLVQQGQQKTYV